VMQAIATFVSRSGIDKDSRALYKRIDAAEKRLDTTQKWVWSAIAAAVSAFSSKVLTKIGLMHCSPLDTLLHTYAGAHSGRVGDLSKPDRDVPGAFSPHPARAEVGFLLSHVRCAANDAA